MNVNEVLDRARSQIGKSIKYKMGRGVHKASGHTCADGDNQSDCSAFVCWALGVDKLGDYPWLVPAGEERDPEGEWYSTDNIVDDALHFDVGFFDRTDEPRAGGVVVYPTRWKTGKASPAGHCGIISAVDSSGRITKVIHCSSGNYRTAGDAVQETGPEVFSSNDSTVHAWCSSVFDTAATAEESLAHPVRFCVVATGAQGKSIAEKAREFADLDLIARRVVVVGDPDYPSSADIQQWTANTPQPGAVVLRPDGSLYKVLDVTKAADGLWIESAFVKGRQ